jgi:predicted HicB family RNase H-like nuclease
MPKKKTSKSVTKKAKAPVKKKAVQTTPTPVAVKGAVGFRLRMAPATHKQLVKLAAQQGVSQNTVLNQLIQDAK